MGNIVFNELYERCTYYVTQHQRSSLQEDGGDLSGASHRVNAFFHPYWNSQFLSVVEPSTGESTTSTTTVFEIGICIYTLHTPFLINYANTPSLILTQWLQDDYTD